ncbi:MAG: hypothetical protein IK002_00240 [Treponema sp.]|uniref:hypothetical protein n=1 Tax=Treponema sp. TaxID=166 RepID=UPI00298EAC76|nr:hypothetical protein [Treponema sp.]MBR5932392.1 hypothetical protein [Treponema sp.]
MDRKQIVELLISLKNLDDTYRLNIKKKLLDFFMESNAGEVGNNIYDEANRLADEIYIMIQKMKEV